MPAAKKAKAKASPKRVRKAAVATSTYSSFENNGIVVFTILAIIFLIIAVVKYL